MTAKNLAELLAARPEIERIEAFVLDVNGVARGKWLPAAKASAVAKGLPLPRSIFALDAWGRDVESAGLAFGTGDPDGSCIEVPGTAAVVPWATVPTAQVMLSMTDGEGGVFYADPRGALRRVVDRLAARGLRAVAATELEFYLADPVDEDPVRPPAARGGAWSRAPGDLLSVDALNRQAPLFDAIAAACAALGVPAETMLRENGAGQYEINLVHVADPEAAADHAVLLKRTVKAVARRHGLIATFMAKPDGSRSGSGMHVHVSLVDEVGSTIFAAPDGAATDALHHAVAGIVTTLPETMLLLAPHANSFRRFRRNSHAPTHANWGMDDRSAAVRVIVGDRGATRIEQRVAGADCHPHLAVAAVLAGIVEGLERGAPPPPAGDRGAARLPHEWGAAIDAFATSRFAARHFGERFRDMLVACKRQDYDEILGRVSDVELNAYRDLA